MTSATRPSTPTDAALGAAATFAWYAMPDIVRSRSLRAVLKAGLAAAAATYAVGTMREDDWQGVRGLARETVADGNLSRGAMLGALGATAAVSLIGESLIFRRGERRGWQGSAFPHSKQALVLGLLAAVTALLPNPEIDVEV